MVLAQTLCLFWNKEVIMPPRVEVSIGRGTRGQGKRHVANREALRAMQQLEERMATILTGRHRGPKVGDGNAKEEETTKEEVEEATKTEVLKVVLGSVMKPKRDISSYIGSMNLGELIDWIT